MLANAVFEGGGVKAIALVGAVSAAESKGIKFHQTAGTSSGAIVASLISAGYNAEAMKKIIMETPFTNFLKTSPLMSIKVFGPVLKLFIKKGLYSGESLEQWIREKLLKKGIRTFGDLPGNKLRIIASDISQGKLLVLPDDIAQYGIDPMKFEIAKAVRMSTSIPYFFEPVIIRKPPDASARKHHFSKPFIYIVDGAILSNFPLWLFDQYVNQQRVAQTVPTIGFQLVGKQSNVPRAIHGPFSMFQALFSTMMEAHDERYIEEENRFRTIKIPTLGVHTTQFDINPESSMKLYQSGMDAASKFFDKWSMTGYVTSYKKHVMAKV